MSEPVEFDLRPKTIGPLKMESFVQGNMVADWEPSVGDTASLRCGPVLIFVKIAKASERRYVGEIVGFERWHEESFKELKQGHSVEFNYDNAFGFGRL
jgi:hypothetical protein